MCWQRSGGLTEHGGHNNSIYMKALHHRRLLRGQVSPGKAPLQNDKKKRAGLPNGGMLRRNYVLQLFWWLKNPSSL